MPSGLRSRRSRGPIELLVLQPTPFCNIDCSYCYLTERSSRQIMPVELLARLFEDLFSGPYLGDGLTVVWHVGEPLVPGVHYYERAFAVIENINRRRIPIAHCFQTNGVLLTQEWVDLFARHRVSVGISLDGPQWLHDLHRRTRRGGGTFDAVMNAVRLLQTNGLPFHVISVLTRSALAVVDEIFEFFLTNEIHEIGFNIEELEGANRTSSLREAADGEVRAFFERFVRLCEMHGGVLRVREFTAAAGAIGHAATASYGNQQTEALRIVTVGVDGTLSTFSPELIGARSDRYSDFRFGSVAAGGIAGILNHPAFLLAERDIAAGVERCEKTCEYFEVCRGGAPANKYFENDDLASTETMFCRYTKKIITDVMLAALERTCWLARPAS